MNSLLKAIEIYTDMGKFVMAAKHHQSIAEIYETEVSLEFVNKCSIRLTYWTLPIHCFLYTVFSFIFALEISVIFLYLAKL